MTNEPAATTATTPATPIEPVGVPSNDIEPPREPTLAEKVSAAQARLAERTAPARAKAAESTKKAARSASDFVKEHPVLAISGAVVAGAAIALALPGKPGRKMRGAVLSTGGLLAELASTYGAQMLAMAEDAAETSKEKLGEIGESFAESSSALASSLSEKGEGTLLSARHISEKAALAARQASEDAAFKTSSIASRLRK